MAGNRQEFSTKAGTRLYDTPVHPTTGVQFAQEALPLSAFSPTAAQAAAKTVALVPGSACGQPRPHTFWAAGQNNWDFSIIKDVHIAERHHLQFRTEMYNLTNRVQFDLPAFVSSSTPASPATS